MTFLPRLQTATGQVNHQETTGYFLVGGEAP
uniref:Uncharacterized protein n=1 Tax=Candidatus Kentrum sp. DK TaxID=2126562 RepID=A0A450SP78_9GAMM|nr:MAG: hypothetical protein BECKDK2373B_GA0170837_10544 [Candidatus Kentron sp. DK]